MKRGTLAIIVFFAWPVLSPECAHGDSPSKKSPFIASPPKVHTETAEAGRHEYVIRLGGAADMDNTTTRGCGSYQVAFQPNISLVIENIGDAPVEDPWIVINGVRDWRNIATLVAEATRGARDDQDKLFLLYEFARSNRYHDLPLFLRDELHDPVKHFNSYGAGLCDDMGSVTCALAYRAGFNKERHGADPANRAMHGHVMCEIPLNGKYQFLDTDENAFYLDPENERPVSGDEIMRDPDLARRDFAYGPIFSTWATGEQASALLGADDTRGRSIILGHEMHLTLRPGERLTYRWDNVGKTPGEGTLRFFGNSFLDYAPLLGESALRLAHEKKDVVAIENGLAGQSKDAFVIFKVRSPYVICGGSVAATFSAETPEDVAAVDLSMNGKTWTELWTQRGPGKPCAKLELDKPLQVKSDQARYEYLLRLRLSCAKPGGVRLMSLAIHTDLLASPIALPRLCLGENKVVYTDATKVAHRVRIIHTFQESQNILPPTAPLLQYPQNDATVRDDAIRFRWAAVQGAGKYHLRVSRRADMLTSYRPCFDVVVGDTSLCNPRTGLFNPSETYYWSVRARNAASGLWGAWSAPQTFRWDGPRPPVDLGDEEREGRLYLMWKANPRGNPPVRYEVYASDMRGFRPSKEPYTVYALGQVPANFVASTEKTEMLIVSPYPSDRAPNKSSYRVIALDANGTPGGTSAPLELAHPYIHSQPVTQATVGRPYAYQVLTLRADGALQHRYQKPSYAFWEKEGYRFERLEGPAWLRINPDSGLLSGAPGEGDAGEFKVKLKVVRTWPQEVKKDQYRPEPFLKVAPRFQAEAIQEFVLRVAQ